MSKTHLITAQHRIYEERDEPATRGLQAYSPRALIMDRLTDHAGSHREDGWAMRIDLADGATLFVQFSRRKDLDQGEDAVYLGVCGGIHSWVTKQEKR